MELLPWGGRRQRLSNRRPRANVVLMPPPSPFEVGETVFVYFEQILYHAKILRKAVYGGHWRYFVHYMYCWKKRYDEWVVVQRILKLTDENSVVMRDTLDRLPGGVNWNSKAPKKPQTLKDCIEKDREALGRKLSVDIPPPLYFAWVEDRDISLHVGQISRVPTIGRTVRQIIEDFRLHLQATVGELEGERDTKVRDFVSLFDARFSKLRYHSESQTSPPQHLQPSQAYGGIHLLRMLFGNMPEEPIEGGFQDLGRLLRFLEANM